MIAAGAAALAISTALALANFTGTDLAEAAATRARSFMDVMEQRSPGARTQGQLTKIKAKHKFLAEREAPSVPVTVPANLAEVLSPPAPALVPVDIAAPAANLFAPPIPAAIFLSPPGVVGGVPGGGGGGPGGGGPGSPPITPPLDVPSVPEPGTWLTMLVGFASIGWSLRWQRRQSASQGYRRGQGTRSAPPCHIPSYTQPLPRRSTPVGTPS